MPDGATVFDDDVADDAPADVTELAVLLRTLLDSAAVEAADAAAEVVDAAVEAEEAVAWRLARWWWWALWA